MDRSKALGKEKVSKLLVRFSVPAIVGMLVQAIYNVVDRIYIANGVGAEGLAGITVSFPIMLVIIAFGLLVGIGANAIISISLGEKKKLYAEKVMGNAFILMIVFGISITIIGEFFTTPILKLFGASDAILVYAVPYTKIILFGAILGSIGFGMNNFIRGEGNPKTAMITMLIGALTNIILDPIFIFVFKMGVEGAAYATLIGQTFSSIWVLRYFLSGKSMLHFHFKNFRLERKIVLRILAIGSAPFSLQIASSITNAVLNNQLQKFGGDVAISAMGIIFSIATLTVMPIFGINQGVQPIIGYNYGAKKYGRVKKAAWLAAAAATIIVLTSYLITRFAPDLLVGAFSKGDAVLHEAGKHGVKLYFLLLPLIGFQIIAANFFQATGQPVKAMIFSLSRQVLFLIPAVLILPTFFGLDGVWYAMPAADLIAFTLTVMIFLREIHKLSRMELKENSNKVEGNQ